MTTETKHTIDLPARFWTDHAERALPAGDLVKSYGNRVRVRCTPEELDEIQDDARHYTEAYGPEDSCPSNIIASARRTVAAIDKYRKTQS